MGVASIPEHKDQQREDRQRDEWPAVAPLSRKMEAGKNRTDEYVTVVSVGGNQPSAENFVTVLSIGKRDEESTGTKENGCHDGHLEEEVEVYRLPGERLGFGLKFEGGNKTSERVRRLFVQSCAEQSPASRAKCSWGTLGEGDEVLSIDGVPVTQMTRLDCVRRLKESQLVIRLTVRCRGALRPEVVSAERKSPAEKSKVPPELPTAPPPVPPRKLRQSRGPADGEANPCPVSRTWDRANPPQTATSGKPGPYENCEPPGKSPNGRNLPKERSPDMQKSKQEPPEAMVYLDARSQCGSTHGSTSDDTGSSMSTVVDKFSTSDRVSTISTVSTTSTTSEQQSADCEEENDRREAALSRALCPFDHLEKEFQTSPPDYLLRRLASSEAVTHVEPRGEVERITAVVAPNTVLIEETITLQPPLSFQDAPLSYGHEARPDLFYAPDLAADSTTHFRPIKDDAALVERVNGEHDDFRPNENGTGNGLPPPLPARNHVNRISVNQQPEMGAQFGQQTVTKDLSKQSPNSQQNAPVLPPKPLPRKDVRRKKLPPPPPPPITPRREPRPIPAGDNLQIIVTKENNVTPEKKTNDTKNVENSPNSSESEGSIDQISVNSSPEKRAEYKNLNECRRQSSDSSTESESSSSENRTEQDSSDDSKSQDDRIRTNKVLEIIEIRKAKALSPQKEVSADSQKNRETVEKLTTCQEENEATKIRPEGKKTEDFESRAVNRYEKESLSSLKNGQTISTDLEVTETDNSSESYSESTTLPSRKIRETTNSEEDTSSYKEAMDRTPSAEENLRRDSDEDETYRSLDEVKDDLKNPDANASSDEDEIESDSTDDSDDGHCCWQSNLATIGEEEETNSLECVNPVNEGNESPTKSGVKADTATLPTIGKDACDKNGSVNDRMENCGGGQRLPPDGDEFPAAYQEFTSDQQYQYSSSARTSTMTSNSNDFISTKTVLVNVEDEENDVPAGEMLNEDKSSPYKVPENSGKRYSSASNVAHFPAYQASNSNVVVFEKKIETVRYYQKENTGQFHKELSAETEVVNRLNKDVAPSEAPPPLPLSGPPKMEPIAGGNVKNIPPVFGQQQQRKFSLNGELRRQDDKSEKSVRDKIAMFSSKDSLEAPLFPTTTTTTTTISTGGRRLSKYRSSDDVCNDDKSPGQRDRQSFFADRTRSSFDLTDSSKPVVCQDYGKKILNSSQTGTRCAYSNSLTGPNVFEKSQSTPSSTTPSAINSPTKINPFSSSLETKPLPSSISATSYGSTISSYSLVDQQIGDSSSKSAKGPILTRATSFSGTTPSIQDRSGNSSETSAGLLISRTNSLASTVRPKFSEDARRSSLNQLIEQRRKSISKLRGLVIPEKDAVSVDQPIVDLPEIKSRDSILLRQIPKANIQDKWGSQSSIASNASTASVPLKPTTSFKMPAPQIHSKYSPAFKRKSLAVYPTGSLTGNSKGTAPATNPVPEPPKSLESISSPTRNDYSFDYASANSSPEVLRMRPKTSQKKTRPDYDDSDNDSAVSSSQSSISRGCSPPMSPVPSERSTVSSERSYVSTETNYQRGSLIMVSPSRSFMARDTVEKERFSYGPSNLVYLSSEGSSSSSGSSHSRSPQPIDANPKNSQIPQRLTLKRSSSSDTNCSTSSTLTSGSQASTESLSRRVLKPQSVEAINRKNILASARCRSGRDLNGSPLIQRKFVETEGTSLMRSENVVQKIETRNNGVVSSATSEQTVKIAYLEETDSFSEENRLYEKPMEETRSSPKRSIPVPTGKLTKSETLEPSNDLRMWVQSEAKSLMRSMEEKPVEATKKPVVSRENDRFGKPQSRSVDQDSRMNSKSSDSEERSSVSMVTMKSIGKSDSKNGALESREEKSKSSMVLESSPEENDLLTVLTTRSRSRSTIHLDGNTFSRSRSQDLDDILSGKIESVARSEGKTESNGVQSETRRKVETIESRREKKLSSSESCEEEKVFVSKIPTLGKSRVSSNNERSSDSPEKSRIASTRIPTSRSLGRRSASVTDMKKALEKADSPSSNSSVNQQQSIRGTHNRFPSLDSSMEESSSAMGSESETDRYCGEQFGSISSLASSTSLISQQELAQLVEEASLEEPRGAHDVIVVPLHKEIPTGSVGITLAGGVDCEVKEITVHRVLAHSIADKDGRIQRGDRILSINGRSTRGLTHRESLAVLKQPRSEIVLVVSRARTDDDYRLKSRTDSVETIVEALETNGSVSHTAWGPPATIAVYKDGAGLGFSLEGGRDSPLGDRPLLIKKIFTGGAAEKTGLLKAGDQLLEVNGNDVTRMSRIEAWSLMKKLHVGEVNLLVRHPATKST